MFHASRRSRAARPGIDSIGQRLHRESILLLAWGPAILLQLAHPLVARGIADHRGFDHESHGHVARFYRTLDAMLQLCFGTEAQADAVLTRINAIHDRVNGHLPEAAGMFPAATPYSAHDPALLAWVHATLLDMSLRVYELYVGPLSVEEKDRYCTEASATETRLGIPEGALPRSVDDLTLYMTAMLSSGQIVVTETARSLARRILHPGPRIAEPALWLVRLGTIGLLPASIRDDYGFAWSARKERMLRRSAAVMRGVLRVTPRMVRHWPAMRAERLSAP